MSKLLVLETYMQGLLCSQGPQRKGWWELVLLNV